MNSGSSASISAGGHSGGWSATSSSYQTSRLSSQATLPPVRFTTTTLATESSLCCSSARSTLAFSGTLRPPRRPSSAVMTSFESQSLMRPARDSGEKPPKTMECGAPMRAQASMATAASGIIGM